MRRRINLKALTLVELVLAMVLTSIIGLAAAGAAMVISNSYENSEQYAQNLQGARAAAVKIQKIVQSCELITDTDATSMLLWASNGDGSNSIRLADMAIVYFDENARQIKKKQVDLSGVGNLNLRNSLNQVLSLDLACNTATMVRRMNAQPVSDIALVENVSNFDVSVPRPDTPANRMVTFTITMGEGSSQVVLRSSAAMRAGKVVGLDKHGDFALVGNLSSAMISVLDNTLGGITGGILPGSGHGNGHGCGKVK